jgi:hypothetical protein
MLLAFTPSNDMIDFLRAYTADHYYKQDQDFEDFLYVSIQEQCMYHISGWEIKREYVISTATLGPGNLSGSNQTPTGLHSIAAMYGEGLKEGAILKARQFTGKIAKIYTDETNVDQDDVTTRIMWLKGDEEGINKGENAAGKKVDSYQRYIYIHGTPEEGLLGKPASHGCIRMKNAEVIELYKKVKKGMKVLILDK